MPEPWAIPVSVVAQPGPADSTANVATYADGSIAVTTLENATPTDPGTISTRGISGCTVTSGSGYATYSGCLISAGDGIKFLSFRASYQRVSGGYAKILSSNSPATASNYGDMTDPVRAYMRYQSTSLQDAVVKYSSVYTSWSSGGSETVYTSLWLTAGGTASVGRS